MRIEEFIDHMNRWGHKGVPFLFVIDFEMQKPLLFKLDDIHTEKNKTYTIIGRR